MHVPDHLIDSRTELIAGVTAAAVVARVAWELRRGAVEQPETSALPATTGQPRPEAPPSPGSATLLSDPERFGAQLATAALVFALQMVNFPVLPGTSGHLLGGALAVALIGPRRALLAVTAVLVTQALVFADGGTGALGVNVWLIAILPVAVAAVAARALDPGRSAGWAKRYGTAGLAAFAGPPVAALGFVAFIATGTTGTTASLGEIARSMIGVHLAIGLGEAALTVAVLAAAQAASTQRRQIDTAPVWGAAIVSAAGLSLLASSAPDGLERVAADLGFAVTGPGSILSGGPLADYAVRGFDGLWSTSLAGLVGVAATCVVCAVLVSLAGTTAPGRSIETDRPSPS